MLKRSWFAFLILIALTLVMTSVAQGPTPSPEASSRDLLDRGSAAAPKADTRTHTFMTATLANLAGTPGVTLGAAGAVAPVAMSVFNGYFYVPGVDFPTSYHPFFVTGAYALIGFLGPPGTAAPILAAGVAPGPFTVGTGTWAAFTAAPGTPLTPFSPGMVFGMKSMFAHSPPTVSVPPGFGVACGIDPISAGSFLAGLLPGTGGGKPLHAFMPPGPGSGLMPIAASPATYVAGCYITGATVPVELQSFHID